MADTLRATLELHWCVTDGARQEEASMDDMRAVVTRDLHPASHSFVFAALVYAGNARLFRSLDYTTNAGSLDRAKALCEMAIAAELWRRAA